MTSGTTTFANRSRKEFNPFLGFGVVAGKREGVFLFQSGGTITLAIENILTQPGEVVRVKCSPKERSTLPRRPKLQEYLSKLADAVFMQGLSITAESVTQLFEVGWSEDKSAHLILLLTRNRSAINFSI